VNVGNVTFDMLTY